METASVSNGHNKKITAQALHILFVILCERSNRIKNKKNAGPLCMGKSKL